MPRVKKAIEKEKKPKKEKKKPAPKEKEAKKPRELKIEKKEAKEEPGLFFRAIGRRKTAIASIRLFTKGEKSFLINDKLLNVYFPILELQEIAKQALEKMNCLDRFGILAKVRGGGSHSQAEAVRHGIARALIVFNPDFRKRLKKAGLLTRDSRMRERKKFGLKRARKAPQWQKR